MSLNTLTPKLVARLIDTRADRVNAVVVDLDDLFSGKPSDPLTELGKQDLGPLSVAELDERVATLRQEIERVELHLSETAAHRAQADALFAKR